MRTVLTLFCTLLLLVSCDSGPKKSTLKIGDFAPSFDGVDLGGSSFRLKDFSDEPVLIRFWDTDCKYCKADTPVFNKLHEDYAAKGLHIAYINTLSDLKDVNIFVNELAIQFPVLMDDGGIIAKAYHVRVVPQTVVINRNHKIIAAISGGVSEDVILDLLELELQ